MSKEDTEKSIVKTLETMQTLQQKERMLTLLAAFPKIEDANVDPDCAEYYIVSRAKDITLHAMMHICNDPIPDDFVAIVTQYPELLFMLNEHREDPAYAEAARVAEADAPGIQAYCASPPPCTIREMVRPGGLYRALTLARAHVSDAMRMCDEHLEYRTG